jgi:hypothetical protein
VAKKVNKKTIEAILLGERKVFEKVFLAVENSGFCDWKKPLVAKKQ